MKRVFAFLVLLLLVIWVVVLSAGEFGVSGDKGVDQNVAARLAADWYDMKIIKMSGESGNDTIASKWPGYQLKGFYNNRRDSSVMVVCKTKQGSMAYISIPSETNLSKLPMIIIVYKTGTTDSVYGLFQKY
jgi:anionic cell wall polymer biosynthesis LytR-Cps2A-Psr (LCP) family protein